MRAEVIDEVVVALTDEVAGLLGRAAALAEAARGARGRAARWRSFALLLEVEPLLRETRGLIAGAGLLRERRQGGSGECWTELGATASRVRAASIMEGELPDHHRREARDGIAAAVRDATVDHGGVVAAERGEALVPPAPGRHDREPARSHR